jgi:hypothetical protein
MLRPLPDLRIVWNKLLRGWYVVDGPVWNPVGEAYLTKNAAQAAMWRMV